MAPRLVPFTTEENTLDAISALFAAELSEPYSVWTYRYFWREWGDACFLAYEQEEMIGCILCKVDRHKSGHTRGYIGMLAVKSEHRRKGLGKFNTCSDLLTEDRSLNNIS